MDMPLTSTSGAGGVSLQDRSRVGITAIGEDKKCLLEEDFRKTAERGGTS